MADGRQYVLAKPAEGKIGFYKAEPETTIAAGKGYLELDAVSPVKAFYFDADGATGIGEIKNAQELDAQNGVIFNLAGQRQSKVQKGINIVNGKKYIVK